MRLRVDAAFAAAAALFYGVGLAGHLDPALRPLMLAATPWALGVYGLAALAVALGGPPARWLIWAGAFGLATFFLEVLGVSTGAVFGSYSYGSVLGPRVLGVPPVIGLNWTLTVLGFVLAFRSLKAFARPGRGRALGHALLAALAATAFDWLMEPTAVAFGYWTWTDGAIPWSNYATWFAASFAGALSFRAFPAPRRASVLAAYAGVQALFFLCLRLAGIAGLLS